MEKHEDSDLKLLTSMKIVVSVKGWQKGTDTAIDRITRSVEVIYDDEIHGPESEIVHQDEQKWKIYQKDTSILKELEIWAEGRTKSTLETLVFYEAYRKYKADQRLPYQQLH